MKNGILLKLMIFGAITGVFGLFVHIYFSLHIEGKIADFVNSVFNLQIVDAKDYNSTVLIGSYITAIVNTVLIFVVYYYISPLFAKYKKIHRILFVFIVLCLVKQTFRGAVMSIIYNASYATTDGGVFMLFVCAFLYMLQSLVLNIILSIALILTCPTKTIK